MNILPISSELSDMLTDNTEEFINDNSDSMHIIINDNDCSDSFFLEICNSLREYGIAFDTSRKCDKIDKDGFTIVTIDQQYNSGKSTMIFAPYNNARNGYSDSLALCFQAAFNQNGYNINRLYCGKIGYFEDDNGNVNKFCPTETELAIDSLSETSFVTISLGTDCKDAKVIAEIIKNALIRQKYFLDNYDKNTDLIYRASTNDSIETVANYFNSTIEELNYTNNIKDSSFQDSQAVINPNTVGMPVFDKDAIFKLSDLLLKVR